MREESALSLVLVGGAGTEAGGATSLGGGPGSNSEGGVATSERGGAEEVIEADRHLSESVLDPLVPLALRSH